MEVTGRLYVFQGNDEDYIRYLETELMQAHKLFSSTARSSRSLTGKPTEARFVNVSHQAFKPKASPNRATTAQWEKEIVNLISNVCAAKDWQRARQEPGFVGSGKSHVAMEFLLGQSAIPLSRPNLDPGHPVQLPQLSDTDNGLLISKACAYARIAIQ
ncbi:hypothetical protein BDV19DRAFT_39564 [Aspergillus venezuelensis]